MGYRKGKKLIFGLGTNVCNLLCKARVPGIKNYFNKIFSTFYPLHKEKVKFQLFEPWYLFWMWYTFPLGFGCIKLRPSKCLNHQNQRLCKIFLACINLLFQKYGVLSWFFSFFAFLCSFFVKVQGNEGQHLILSFNSIFTRYA